MMSARDLTALVHLVGFATGIALYVMLGVMTRRRLTYVDAGSDLRNGRLPLFTAVLGVVWNAGAMFVYAMRDFRIGEPVTLVGAFAYTALGFLPAVVVHSTLNRSQRRQHRWLLWIAYGASALAGLLHLAAAARGELFSSSGLLLLTLTYPAVIVVLSIVERGRPGFQRSITAVALAAFAVSALHLSRHSGIVDTDPWPVELIGHHASLPLVLAILYQDYRFAFADLFLKRALSLVALVAVVALVYATVAAPLVDPHLIGARVATGDAHLLNTGVLLVAWVGTALVYPWIQRRVFRFVDRVVLRRVDYRQLRVDVARRLAASTAPDEALQAATGFLASALDASHVVWTALPTRPAVDHATITLDASRCRALVMIPTVIGNGYEITIDELQAGRTMLSDDLAMIDGVATSLARRLDDLRVEAERTERTKREDEMRRLATEAELRALRAQLNPHFLFNALNTLGHLMQSAPDRALTTLYQLTGLLRAVLRRTNGQFVSFREELEIVEAYLAIERERFQERLTVAIDVDDEVRHTTIPPLLLQPLVENAVKHGIAPLRQGGAVRVHAHRDVVPGEGAEGGYLRVIVEDTGIGAGPRASEPGTGIGLSSIESRLRHYYGGAAAMTMRETPGGGTTVELCLPWMAPHLAGPASIR
ncbi:MAG TPA: histidine kinase [Gemmatimonadaceae bacterium]|jgi:signal transduction histidine kinase|nr:histidine kinase [Gemmatimonadaceae bacterium]